MGLYEIRCPNCDNTHQWFSGNFDQRCDKCQKVGGDGTKISLNTSWGELDFNQPIRDHIKHFIRQLEWFLTNNRSSNRAYTEIDLKGYRILLDEGSDETIRKFMEVKRNARDAGKRFSNNVDVVNHMKVNGLWERKK